MWSLRLSAAPCGSTRATAPEGFKPRRQIGVGWHSLFQNVTPGDVTGDGNADVIATDTSDRLWLYPGNGGTGFSPRRQIGNGWGGFTITNAANMNGTGRPDLLARDSAGTLWLYPLTGNAVIGTRVKIGDGWNGYTILGPGDFNGDGLADILARDSSGLLWLYRGKGTGAFFARSVIGPGWRVFTALVTPGNWDHAGATTCSRGTARAGCGSTPATTPPVSTSGVRSATGGTPSPTSADLGRV